jgi:tRNA threonylcarbamoyladenosine biosynthesis protein TsaB
MALILNIDTATERASVCIADNDNILFIRFNEDAKQHASFLQPAIQELCSETNIQLKDIDAVAVSNGPGSYTGLRVGLSSAKGICFALKKPLILINTLTVMAEAGRNIAENAELICPMIDARRMEVFTAVFDKSLSILQKPAAEVLNEGSFQSFLNRSKILFFGSGAVKWQALTAHPNAQFSDLKHDASHLNSLSQSYFQNGDFADLAYAEPFYLKPFFDTHKL